VPVAAPDLGARQAQVIAQQIGEFGVRADLGFALYTIHH
jgi:hypothetical protein